ncbi:MAG: hypothetical protein HQM11_04815 [SAR324 cluster bacterium]|nr:hypothetical protein [SAR324 cluster bacterium]
MLRITGIIGICFLLISCTDPRVRETPYEQFFDVGLFGHGRGLLGDLKLNIYGIQRRCDSCHTNRPEAHNDLGTCNLCHQPSFFGWKQSTAALYHSKVLVLEGKKYHFTLKCKECHQDITNRTTYRKVQCISCHNHSKADVRYAHQLMDEGDFDMKRDNTDVRCVDCHVKTGKEYSKYYNVATGEYL